MTDDIKRSARATISAGDYVKANKHYTLSHSLKPGSLIFWAVIVVCFLWLFLRPPVILPFGIPSDFVVGGLIGLMVLPFVFYFIFAPVSARLNYRKQKTLQQPFELSWSEAGFRTSNESGDWNIKWTDFYGWSESADVFLLFQSPRLFNIVPKRALTPAQVEDLRQTIMTARGETKR